VVAHYPTKSSTKSFLYVYRLEVKVQDFSMHSNTQTSLSLFGLLGGQVVKVLSPTTNIEKKGYLHVLRGEGWGVGGGN